MKKILPAVVIAAIIHWHVSSQIVGQELLDTANWPASYGDRASLPKEHAYSYEFADVQISSIEKWLAWARIRLPVSVSGELSGWLWGQRSQNGWLNFRGYRLEGEISSPKLVLDNWYIAGAKLRFGYIDDSWYISKLTGDLSTAKSLEVIGTATISATIDNAAPRLLRVTGTFDDAKLQHLPTC